MSNYLNSAMCIDHTKLRDFIKLDKATYSDTGLTIKLNSFKSNFLWSARCLRMSKRIRI